MSENLKKFLEKVSEDKALAEKVGAEKDPAALIALAKEAGLTMTGAGAAFPYGNDPEDRNIRIAPTSVDDKQLALAMEVFTVCVKLAAVNKLLEAK